MKLFVGLGNPGPDYENHRHNIGHWVLDGLAKQYHLKWEESSKLFVASWGNVEGEDCWLAKSRTYMNVSGKAVQVLLKEKAVAPKDLVVVHDDMDLLLGTMRWVFGAGFGGHNGVRSIIEAIQTKEFCRLRLGIGRPPAHQDPADYVLQPFAGEDLKTAEGLTERAIGSMGDFIKHNLEWVQNHYH